MRFPSYKSIEEHVIRAAALVLLVITAIRLVAHEIEPLLAVIKH